MNKRRIAFASALVIAAAAPSFAVEPATVGWDDLSPAPAQYENPFSDLTSEQMDALRQILRFELANDSASSAQTSDQISALRQDLSAQGLDVDRLFAQRETIIEARRKAAVSTNEELVGGDVRLPGYILPLEMKDQKAIEFLLVPTVGACIHTPPPPANQIVHVKYPQGIKIDGMFTPVWIEGALMSNFTLQELYLVDGQTQIEVSYAMSAKEVTAY